MYQTYLNLAQEILKESSIDSSLIKKIAYGFVINYRWFYTDYNLTDHQRIDIFAS